MPNRNEPGSAWFTASHVVTAGVGVVGVVVDASPNVVAVLGPVGYFSVVLWSSLFVLSGALGIVARWKGWYWAETIAVDMTSAGLVLWGAMVLVTASSPSMQAGVRFIASALLLHGWAVYRRHRLRAREVTMIEDAVREGLRG